MVFIDIAFFGQKITIPHYRWTTQSNPPNTLKRWI